MFLQKVDLSILLLIFMCIYTPWSKYMANRAQKVGYPTGLKYKPVHGVPVPSTFTLVYSLYLPPGSLT